MTDEYSEHYLSMMKINQLKEILALRNLPISGNKKELVTRIVVSSSDFIPVKWPSDKKIYFVRHLRQTRHRYRDPPIITGQTVRPVDCRIIFTSPYLRARQTADIFNLYSKVKIKVDVRISEYQGGKESISGTLTEETRSFGGIPDETENYEDFVGRVDNFLDYLWNSKYSKILVICHGLVVKHIQEKLDVRKIYHRGCSVPYGKGIVISR